jgi:hypothetical protein
MTPESTRAGLAGNESETFGTRVTKGDSLKTGGFGEIFRSKFGSKRELKKYFFFSIFILV